MKSKLFWSKVKLGETSEDCWLWLASVNKDGYGQFWVGDRFVPAHRYAYVYFASEPISPEDLICHTCDNPACCNPHHLFKGTIQDNVDDKMRKGRHGSKSHPRYYEGEVYLMHKMYSNGFTTSLIAKVFKGHQGTIWRLLHNPGYTPKEANYGT